MENMSSRNISEQRMVYKFLNNREVGPSKKSDYGKMWANYLDEEIDLSGPMRTVAYRTGYMKNRGRAVGLFLGSEELIRNEPEGEEKVSYPVDKKRESLIEAFQYPAEQPPLPFWKEVPRAVIIPEVTEILKASELPTPQTSSVEQYVEKKCREIS